MPSLSANVPSSPAGLTGPMRPESLLPVPDGRADGCAGAGIDDLDDSVLLHVFRILAVEQEVPEVPLAGRHFAWFRRSLPVVCRRWGRLLGPAPAGKFSWTTLVVCVEAEVARVVRKRLEPSGSLTSPGASPGMASGSGAASSLGTPAAGLPGSSPPASHMFKRPSLGSRATVRSAAVVSWAEGRGEVQHLLLDLTSSAHDFNGGHTVEALLRASNRGPRGLRTLRLNGAAGVGGPDSYEMLGRLRGLAELHVNGLPQGFLAATLPYLSSLTGLTRIAFTPEALQFPVTIPTLPSCLKSLSLTQLWLNKLPPLASVAPQLEELALLRCCLVEGVLDALSGAPGLRELRLDGTSLTTHTGGRLEWERCRSWPACRGIRVLSLVGCGLHVLPPAVVFALPGLQLLDLSNNPELGGATNAPDMPYRATSGCLPAELVQLTALAEVRLASCGLTLVPPSLLGVSSITALDLSLNSLSTLPLPLPAKPASPSLDGASAALAWPSQPAGAAAGRCSSGAAFADALSSLNISLNRFTVWPQGLAGCRNLRELVLGASLVARAAEGELERCMAALPQLARLEVRGASFEPRAVRSMLAVQRWAALERPGMAVLVTGV